MTSGVSSERTVRPKRRAETLIANTRGRRRLLKIRFELKSGRYFSRQPSF